MKPGREKDRTLAASWRSSSHIDPELRDDGTSPVKKLPEKRVTGATQRRSITFEGLEGPDHNKEKGEQQGEMVAGELHDDHVGDEDKEGNNAMQKAAPQLESKKDMEVDDDMLVEMKEKTQEVGRENPSQAQGMEGGGEMQVNENKQEGMVRSMEGGGVLPVKENKQEKEVQQTRKRKPGTWRRQNSPGGSVVAVSTAIAPAKRHLEEEDNVQISEQMKKRKVAGGDGREQVTNTTIVTAGRLSQSCLDK